MREDHRLPKPSSVGMDSKVVVFAACALFGAALMGFIFFTSHVTNAPMFSMGAGKDEL